MPSHAYTPSGLNWFKDRGLAYSRATVAKGGYTPKAGDIIYFKSSRNSNICNHVGIVTGYSGGTVYTVEGNTSSATISTNGGAVAAKSYSISNTYIVYICSPKYSGGSISTGNTSNDSALAQLAKTASFNATYYANKYADLKAAFGTDANKLYNHFLQYGIKEGRQASPIFNINTYLNNNGDLKAAFGSDKVKAYNHFKEYGIKEARITASAANLGDSFYAQITNVGSGLNLSINSATGEVLTYHATTSDAQIWKFTRQSDGSYTITNKKLNKCMDVPNGSYQTGKAIGTYESNGSNAQRWFLYSVGGGKYILRAKCASGCVLDVKDGSTAENIGLQNWTYNGSNSQQFTITKLDTNTKPVITDAKVTNVTASGYTVTATITASAGLDRVTFPTWTEEGGQDDIIWGSGSQNGSVFTYQVRISDHENEGGEYNTHIYAYDKNGNQAGVALSTTLNTKPVITDAKITNVDATGYTVTCTATAGSGISKVEMPTWTDANGQDDLIWHQATKNGNTYSFRVKIADHKNEGGKYITHIYARDNSGNHAFKALEVTIDLKPVIKDAKITDVSSTGYTVSCTVTAAAGIAKVEMPTWTDANGQDDIIWHKVSPNGNTYTLKVKTSDHNREVGNYNTHIYAYDNAGNKVGVPLAVTLKAEVDSQTGGTLVDLGDNFYAKIYNPHAGLNLSLLDTQVITYGDSSKPAQVWNFVRQSDGSYKIINCKNGLCLDVNGGGSANSTPVQIYKDNGAAAQRWKIYDVGGKYVLKPQCATSTVLDVKGASTQPEAIVQIYTYNGSDAQKFEIRKTSKPAAVNMEVIRKIMYAVETGGQVYGQADYTNFTEAYTNSDTEHAITIGAGQWYAGEAKTLLNNIRKADPALFASLDTAGIAADLDSKDWSTYKLSKGSAKAKCIQAIIGSSVGKACQDALMDEQMAKYMAEAADLGVTNVDAQMMCANIRHQGGLKALKRVLGKTTGGYTLDNIYAALQTDTGNQVGAYKSRQKMVYESLKKYL